MKYIIILVLGFVFAAPGVSFAQGMMDIQGDAVDDNHTAREEAEGKAVWEKLQAEEVSCEDLSDEDFGALGEYFMGLMTGTSHEAMNAMMIQMMGEEGEEQVHVAMGKRLSGCDTSATFSPQGMSFMPMMQMMGGGMMGGWSTPFNTNQSFQSMMGFGFTPLGAFGWIFMILWWVLIVVAIVALVRWLMRQSSDTERKGEKTALEILKERYAKGEIDKKEFEEKKNTLQ